MERQRGSALCQPRCQVQARAFCLSLAPPLRAHRGCCICPGARDTLGRGCTCCRPAARCPVGLPRSLCRVAADRRAALGPPALPPAPRGTSHTVTPRRRRRFSPATCLGASAPGCPPPCLPPQGRASSPERCGVMISRPRLLEGCRCSFILILISSGTFWKNNTQPISPFLPSGPVTVGHLTACPLQMSHGTRPCRGTTGAVGWGTGGWGGVPCRAVRRSPVAAPSAVDGLARPAGRSVVPEGHS